MFVDVASSIFPHFVKKYSTPVDKITIFVLKVVNLLAIAEKSNFSPQKRKSWQNFLTEIFKIKSDRKVFFWCNGHRQILIYYYFKPFFST